MLFGDIREILVADELLIGIPSRWYDWEVITVRGRHNELGSQTSGMTRVAVLP